VVELMELRRRTWISARSLNAGLRGWPITSTNFALEDGQLISALQISQMAISRSYADQLVLWLVTSHCGEEVGWESL
jgi:hypothetical protein